MDKIRLKARAKINLALDVIKKREDGYHEVSMIMQTVNLFDELEIKKIKKNDIILKTNLPFIPTDQNNLVYKAVQIIKENYSIKTGLFIRLDKAIPVAAGLAGGSSDAAAALVGLNKLFELGLSMDKLMKLGVKIGADVPYCLLRGTALAKGIGEKLTPLSSMPMCHVVLAKPSISVSTAAIYSKLNIENINKHPDIDSMILAIKEKDIYQISNLMENVLETVTEKEFPIIKVLKDYMLKQGAVGAMMSGSGPTVFGIFDDKDKAKSTMYKLKLNNYAKQVYLTTIFNRERGRGYAG
ncbi:MAG: 4-(cytidine 5'-diphospho)-2-C-methyl-D-erythritol kinase [Eubacteriales bacterium]